MPSKTRKGQPERRSEPRVRYLRPGAHIAPYVSEDFELVVLVIDIDGALVGEYAVPESHVEVGEDEIEGGAPIIVWEGGIHVAPWRPIINSEINRKGTVFLGIGGCGRLLCSMTADTAQEVAATRADIVVQLDVLERSPRLIDPDDDDPDDDFEDD